MKYKLDDIKNKEYFKVPDGYFEKLPFEIRNKVSSNTSKGISIIPKLAWISAFIFIFSLGIYWFNTGTETSDNISLDNYSNTELVEFMINEGVSLSEIIQNTSAEDVLYNFHVEEEYLMEEELLYDLEWFEDTSNIINEI